MSVSDGSSTRSLSEISPEQTVRISLDLVAAARRNLGFLKLVDECQWLHERPTILESIRRYDQLWMPLASDIAAGSEPPMVLPPLDVEWVWYCHTLNPASYRQYCESRFSKLIGKPTIFYEENEEYALTRCKEIWVRRYPSEPFENESSSDMESSINSNEELLLDMVLKQRYLNKKFREPYYSELVYLVSARQRYKGFLYIMHRFGDSCSRWVPTSDILIMWLTHQSYPTAYAADTKEVTEDVENVLKAWEVPKEEEIEGTKRTWEQIFDQPYEKAGGEATRTVVHTEPSIYWEVTEADVNTKYKSMLPRFLLEVCITIKKNPKTDATHGNISKEFLRLKVVKRHNALKLDRPVLDFTSESWRKAWHLYCEFGTKGVIVEIRHHGGRCFKGSSLRDSVTFLWNDLLRAPSLTLSREVDQTVRVFASITPPVQASYLLKCVPDQVTDDSGAMISDVILRMNRYHPQEGRWLCRTVLDHAGRECFVVRMRIGGGFWRRGGETPSAVKWEDRIIEIRQGSWSYIAGSIGKAPEKVTGTATPKEPPEGWQAAWNFSTGNELFVRLGSETSGSGMSFDLTDQQTTESKVKLLEGRKLQFQVKTPPLDSNGARDHKIMDLEDQEEEGFVTLVRFSEDDPDGKATALINWKLLAVEFLPEEDGVLVLLLCLSIVRSISEMRKDDVGSLLVRRRIKEAKLGDRDWGSVILHPSSYSPSVSSPFLQPWYWNAKAVMASQGTDNVGGNPVLNNSQAEGSDKLYKRGILIKEIHKHL